MTEPQKGPRRPARPAEEGAIEIPAGPREGRLDTGGPDATGPAGGTDEVLALPEGAWLALRKSGGLLFSSREVVIYPDGRLTESAIGGGGPARTGAVRRLTAAQLAALRGALAGVDFGRPAAPAGRQRPDAYAYEIVARVGRATRAVEVFEGSIPPPLAPLIRQLNHLLAAED